jgi:hypothetical protein
VFNLHLDENAAREIREKIAKKDFPNYVRTDPTSEPVNVSELLECKGFKLLRIAYGTVLIRKYN